jgi:uncharacterized protein YeeX (DUF496 family)
MEELNVPKLLSAALYHEEDNVEHTLSLLRVDIIERERKFLQRKIGQNTMRNHLLKVINNYCRHDRSYTIN